MYRRTWLLHYFYVSSTIRYTICCLLAYMGHREGMRVTSYIMIVHSCLLCRIRSQIYSKIISVIQSNQLKAHQVGGGQISNHRKN